MKRPCLWATLCGRSRGKRDKYRPRYFSTHLSLLSILHLHHSLPPSLYRLLISVAREKSHLLCGCQHIPAWAAHPQKHAPTGFAQAMHHHGTHSQTSAVSALPTNHPAKLPLVWSWEIEHGDRKKEARADAAVHGAAPFQGDRKLLKDIVKEKMGTDVARITFLGAGTSCLDI